MDNKEYAKIIARNLNRIAAERHKTQADLIHDLKLNQGTVSTWFVGTRIPRMDKIDMHGRNRISTGFAFWLRTKRSGVRIFYRTGMEKSPEIL